MNTQLDLTRILEKTSLMFFKNAINIDYITLLTYDNLQLTLTIFITISRRKMLLNLEFLDYKISIIISLLLNIFIHNS